MTIITATELAKFAPHGTATIAKAVLDHADEALPKWGINTAARLQMFMAMAKVESAGFAKLFEDMDYSAARLVQVWPSRFPNIAAATPYANNPEALANKVYGGRLGNTGPNDGFQLRGQGLLQITGRDNVGRLAKTMGVGVDQCRAMLTADATMLECAAATFSAWGCLPFADRNDVKGCTLMINGGLNGLADREAAYALAKQVWPTIRAIKPPVAVASVAPGKPVALPPVITPSPKPQSSGWWARIVAALGGKAT